MTSVLSDHVRVEVKKPTATPRSTLVGFPPGSEHRVNLSKRRLRAQAV